MSEPRDSAADYADRGHGYRSVWEILSRGCAVPPSVDVFDHELALEQRKTPGLAAQVFARRLVRTYHQVSFEGFPGSDE